MIDTQQPIIDLIDKASAAPPFIFFGLGSYGNKIGSHRAANVKQFNSPKEWQS